MHPRAAINSANASRQNECFWNQQRLHALRSLAAAGKSASAIAANIGAGCTRNMVIGKARRAGIALNGRPAFVELQRERGRIKRAERARKRRLAVLRKRIERAAAELAALEAGDVSRASRETSEKFP